MRENKIKILADSLSARVIALEKSSYLLLLDLQQKSARIKVLLFSRLRDQRGIGTLELIFITVIVLGMAVLFRNQITEIFKKIYEALQKLNGNLNTDPLSQQST